ncbi:ion transport peptide isoform X2 [Phymastichus coffea]|uniref:ion transport peptide isoform X2 n=1 Tax=Phymastichus coffea TaxID=108790 RepID=UPI00273AC867|nr:ion transport peptide isoform X2 [Phymastichus coffea]
MPRRIVSHRPPSDASVINVAAAEEGTTTSIRTMQRRHQRETARCSAAGPRTPASTAALLSVLACSLAILLVSTCLGSAEAGALMGHPFSKRSFMDIQCKGVYDKSLFARLDRICEDCYNLFREPQLHTLCRQNCFGSEYFTSCIQALLLEDEKEKFQEIAEYLGRKK